MGKKYMDTKKGSLESSVLDVWQDAVDDLDEKYTEAQRKAREKARGSAGRETSPAGRIRSQDRNYAAKTGKYSDKIKGTFRGMDARDDAKRKLELLRKKRQALSKEREKIAASYEPDVELLDVLDEEILFLTDLIIEEDSVDAITRMDGRTKAYRGHRAKLEAARAKREAKKLDPVGQEDDDVDNDGDTDSSDEYLKKRRKAVSKAVKNEAHEIGTDEYREYLQNLTPGETDPEWVKVRDFKVSSMKEALAKVWGLNEEDPSDEEDEEEEKKTKSKNGKTETGKKAAAVDVNPDLKEKKK